MGDQQQKKLKIAQHNKLITARSNFASDTNSGAQACPQRSEYTMAA
jgi:hypothetical protein